MNCLTPNQASRNRAISVLRTFLFTLQLCSRWWQVVRGCRGPWARGVGESAFRGYIWPGQHYLEAKTLRGRSAEQLDRREDGVGDAGCFDGCGDVVDANDMSSGEDGGGVGGEGGVEALRDGRGRVGIGVADVGGREGVGEEALAREADQKGAAEGVEGTELGEQGVVLVAKFSEAEAGVKEDAVEGNTGLLRGLEMCGEFLADEGFDRGGIEAREGVPDLGGPAGVHEDEAGWRAAVGEGEGHGGVPGEAADVVDDLGAGVDGGAGGGAVVGVDGEDGLGAGGADGFEDGEETRLLLGGREFGRVGAGGFGANVEDMGAAIEDMEAMLDGGLGEKELAAIGEAVGRDVEDAHDEGAIAEREGAGAETPEMPGARAEGHPGSLAAGMLGWPDRLGRHRRC